MRTIILLFIFAAIGSQAEGTSDITNKVTEIDRNKDGKIDVRIESVYRAGTKVLTTTSHPNAQGLMTVWSRGYYVGGDLVMIESDEDGDGVLETLSVLRPGDMEVFTRQADGPVTPISTEKLQIIKKQNAAIQEFWDNAFQPDFDTNRAADLFEETRQKIQDAGKAKTNEEK